MDLIKSPTWKGKCLTIKINSPSQFHTNSKNCFETSSINLCIWLCQERGTKSKDNFGPSVRPFVLLKQNYRFWIQNQFLFIGVITEARKPKQFSIHQSVAWLLCSETRAQILLPNHLEQCTSVTERGLWPIWMNSSHNGNTYHHLPI